jgi:hypothetical protein
LQASTSAEWDSIRSLIPDSESLITFTRTIPKIILAPETTTYQVVGKPEPKVDAVKLAQGKPAFTADIEMRALLHAGQAVVRVPSNAIGFQLETPGANVVDLGTEFAVKAGLGMSTDVQVYDGAVMGEEVDPAHMYEIKADLDQSGIYLQEEIDRLRREIAQLRTANEQALPAADYGEAATRDLFIDVLLMLLRSVAISASEGLRSSSLLRMSMRRWRASSRLRR